MHKENVMAKACRRWTDEDKNFIARNYSSMSIEEMASNLDRTPLAVTKQIQNSVPGFYAKYNNSRGPDRHYSPWLEQDELKLTELLKTGATLSEIADKLNRSYLSIQGKVRKNKLRPKRKRDDINWADVQSEYDNGALQCDLMKKYRVSWGTFKDNVKTKRLRTSITDEEKEIIEERYLNGCTCTCISKSMHVSVNSVSKLVNEHKLGEHAQDLFGDVLNLTETLLNDGFSARDIAEKLDLSIKLTAQIIGIVKSINEME
jgi:transposase